MSEKIAIIGAGVDKAAIVKTLAGQGDNDVMVLTLQEAKDLADNPLRMVTDVYKIEPAPILKYTNEKEFICKGKHQYRKVNGKWICQCGRPL